MKFLHFFGYIDVLGCNLFHKSGHLVCGFLKGTLLWWAWNRTDSRNKLIMLRYTRSFLENNARNPDEHAPKKCVLKSGRICHQTMCCVQSCNFWWRLRSGQRKHPFRFFLGVGDDFCLLTWRSWRPNPHAPLCNATILTESYSWPHSWHFCESSNNLWVSFCCFLNGLLCKHPLRKDEALAIIASTDAVPKFLLLCVLGAGSFYAGLAGKVDFTKATK